MNWNKKMKSETEFSGLKWLLPVMIILVISCGRTRPPAHIMSQPEMVQAFMEVYIAEEKINRLALPRDSATKIFDSLTVRIFERISVQDTVFKSSLLYYTERPEQMQKILSTLVDSLQLREQKAPGQNAP